MNKRDSLMDLISIQDRMSRLFDDTLVTENSWRDGILNSVLSKKGKVVPRQAGIVEA